MFDAMSNSISQIMAQYGQDGFLCIKSTGEYNPETSSVVVEELRIPSRIIVMDYMLKRDGNTVGYESLITQANKKIYVLPTSKTDIGSEIILKAESDYVETEQGIQYRVLAFKTINPTSSNPYVHVLYCKQ